MNLSFILISSMPTKGMKSMGNVGLLPVNKKCCILDKHIQNIKSVYPTAEIIVVAGFEHQRIARMLKKYQKVKCISHDMQPYSNETESMWYGLRALTNTKCIVLNINFVAGKALWTKIKYRSKKSLVLLNSNKYFKNELGATLRNDKLNYIFFGLPNKIANIYLLQESHIKHFLDNYSENARSKYLFETINTLAKHQDFYYDNINYKNMKYINNAKDYNSITQRKVDV